MDNIKNPWIPCHLTNIVEEEEKIEKINEKINEQCIEINLDKTNYKNESAYLLVSLSKLKLIIINFISFYLIQNNLKTNLFIYIYILLKSI